MHDKPLDMMKAAVVLLNAEIFILNYIYRHHLNDYHAAKLYY